jgi:hypothetical protein
MKIALLLLRLIGPVLFIGSMFVLYILFPERLKSDSIMLFSSVAFSFFLGNLAYIPISSSKGGSDTAQMGTIGVAGFFGLLTFLISAVGLYVVIKGSGPLGLAINVVAITVFVVMLLVVNFTSRFLTKVSDQLDFGSSHAKWSAKLQTISNRCAEPALKSLLSKAAEDSMFLSRDLNKFSNELNLKIDNTISLVEAFIDESKFDAAKDALNDYQSLVSQRETELKTNRRKV